MNVVRAGIVGLGGFFRSTHLPCLKRTENVRIAACCDNNEENRAKAAELIADNTVAWYSDFSDMLHSGKIDAVYVITQAAAMPTLVPAAAEAGFPVFCEKPPGNTSTETRAIADAVEAAGVINLVAFNRRFGPLTTKLNDWMAAGIKPTRIQTVFHRVFCASPLRIAGSGIHAIDKTISIMGPVRKVSASHAVPREGQGFCAFTANLEFQSGAIGTFLYDNRMPLPTEEYHINAVGKDTFTIDHYSLHFPPPNKLRGNSFVARRRMTYRDWGEGQAIFDTEDERFACDDLEPPDDLHIGGGYQGEHDTFAAAVLNDTPTGPTFAQAVHSMEVAEAIQAGETREFSSL